MQVDIVSDLHVEHWLNEPIDWRNVKKSDILIVAGDVSDDLNLVVFELEKMSEVYENVLFIDGNHEHQNVWPDFDSSIEYLKENTVNTPQIKFLYDQIYIDNRIAFIAKCGWWDFRIGEPKIKNQDSKSYLQKHTKIDMSETIERKSYEDASWIAMKVCELQNDDNIDDIVIFTHTLPHKSLISWGLYPEKDVAVGCYGNSLLAEIPNIDRARKIKQWIFGHNHDSKDTIINGIRYTSNPRGRPRDFNRESYKPLAIQIGGE